MKELKFLNNGDSVRLLCEQVGSQIWVHANGETFTISSAAQRSGGRDIKNAKINSNQIVAPMPGKIIKIHSPLGQKVSENQTVIVMEAMKMEYTLKAQVSGVIKELRVKEGQQVKLQELLVVIDENH